VKLHILSDVHVEFEDFEPPETGADVVVLAGDIHVGVKGLEWAAARFPSTPVIYVLGNHEYYGAALPKHTRRMRELSEGSNVRVLENERAVIDGVVFLGCTLWTDFRLFGDPRIAGYEATQKMTDYKKIRVSPEYRRLRSVDTAGEHNLSLQWLTKELDTCSPAKTVIVTHHAPSAKSLPEGYAGDMLSAAYVSELDDFVSACGVPLWVHGHLHAPSDYVLGRTRVLCNPRGYPDESNAEFIPDLLVEL
jgi:predicted phosphodiesterase